MENKNNEREEMKCDCECHFHGSRNVFGVAEGLVMGCGSCDWGNESYPSVERDLKNQSFKSWPREITGKCLERRERLYYEKR